MHYRLDVNDAARALKLLTDNGFSAETVESGLNVYMTRLQSAEAARLLVENNIAVYGLTAVKKTLSDAFLEATGKRREGEEEMKLLFAHRQRIHENIQAPRPDVLFVLVILNCFLAGLNVYESYTTAGGNFSLETELDNYRKSAITYKTNCSNTNPNCLPPTKAPSPGSSSADASETRSTDYKTYNELRFALMEAETYAAVYEKALELEHPLARRLALFGAVRHHQR